LDSVVVGDASSRAVLRQISILAMAAKELAGPTAGFREKMAAVRRVIYEPGPWNEHRPFRYDLADPLGIKIENKLLSTYLRTRRGNCISMPVLFVILAQRLGIDATLAVAPLHVFVKVTDPTGREWNIEATDGANAMRADWYRQKFGISERAIESGIYMRKLSPQESAALLGNVVVEKLLANGRYQEAATAAGQILAVSPRDIHAMLQQGTAYARLLETEFDARYPKPAAIPQALRPRWQMLVDGNRRAFAKAEELGWTPAP
jgi:regulator of sirC expression with transglutaminase-like and TPR domain